jgi:hypothetical protein
MAHGTLSDFEVLESRNRETLCHQGGFSKRVTGTNLLMIFIRGGPAARADLGSDMLAFDSLAGGISASLLLDTNVIRQTISEALNEETAFVAKS